MILSIVYTWALMILFCLGFSIGYYSYRSIKRKFDEEYGKKGLLFKRVIHGIVYILLLSLVHEAVIVRLGENPLSKEVEALCNDSISIPMNRDVESLNVAVTASLIAFMA